jgi:uncharacterized protein
MRLCDDSYFIRAMRLKLQHLRQHAIATSLFRPSTLRHALDRLGFVQADPIRSPARAQDLILRLRVKGYRVGDLDRYYPSLGLEEDYLYAYGFMPQATWRLLHPRMEHRLSAVEAKILDVVSAHNQIHPRELEAYLGRKREINAWGGYSKATTRSLEALHYRGLLRIARREKGIRLYEAAAKQSELIEPDERLRRLVLLIASILAPLTDRSLQSTLRQLGHAAPHLEGRLKAVRRLLASGDLESADVNDRRYVWPAGHAVRKRPEEKVRFLAPFDPLVWDRRRFEHFWGWAYRFEAYTPMAKRKLGYYAMPLLWRDDVVGWVNVSSKPLSVEAGFLNGELKDAAFRREFEAEVERFRLFLGSAKDEAAP